MTYPQVIKYLESFINYERFPAWPYRESLKLERIKGFLEVINNPQESLKCIHIAGSKGKGSTCAFVAYILREAGFKVGLYTSPHLSDFRERIRILTSNFQLPCLAGRQATSNLDFEGMISQSALTGLVERLKPTIEKYNRNSTYGPLSFFEVYTALAFVYFKEKKVDFAVLETGLGGRLDATNVVNPLVCVITPISYEHTQKLGKTLKEIAGEKAGIIKVRSSSLDLVRLRSPQVARDKKFEVRSPIVISAPQEKEARDIIHKRCESCKVELQEINKHKLRQHKIRLLGKHQQVNANVAVRVVKALGNYGINISQGALHRGLYNTAWPGRCEAISKKPFIVLDGAQNIASCLALKSTLKENFKYKKLILVLGISCDKDIKGICRQLGGLADEVIVTCAGNPRAAKPQNLAKYFRRAYVTSSVDEAKKLSGKIAGKEDLVLVTGSLFVVGEFRNDARRLN